MSILVIALMLAANPVEAGTLADEGAPRVVSVRQEPVASSTSSQLQVHSPQTSTEPVPEGEGFVTLQVGVSPRVLAVPTTTADVEPDMAVPAGQEQPAPAVPGEIVITGRREAARDPLRAINTEAFGATQKVDSAVIGPVAREYKKVVPSPIRKGIHNFLYNLREPIVFLNFLLQLKPGKAVETVGRFAINTTIGAVGVVDMARRKPFKLPRRSNGFANTLGYYGVKNGPFLFLPLVGPTTVRDLFGGAIDRLILPTAVGTPFTSASYAVPAGILGALDHRSEFDQTLKDLHDNSPDPYAATRAFYLNRREAEIDQLHDRGDADPAGMTGPPSSVRPFVPKALTPTIIAPNNENLIEQ
jgi:phospholipid-binding lipoprotein MlaA